MTKDLLTIEDLSRSELESIFKLADEFKTTHGRDTGYHPLRGKTLAMIFKKPSTRTRVSFEVGMYQLGGNVIFLNTQDIQMGRGESIADTAKILSRYVDGILIRTFSQSEVKELAREASIPVINGLTDQLHPCQIIADLFTIRDKLAGFANVKLAYIGDGNNIANSWLWGAAKLGLHLVLGTPPSGYGPDEAILEAARSEALQSGGLIEIKHDIYQAVKGAQVIYTDVWTSMGQEAEAEQRRRDFAGYQVTNELLKSAAPQAIIMHCLPVHRGEEITAEVIDGERSIIFDQAENRLHVNKAILKLWLERSGEEVE
jgi:ornithine carbamoyltransferase